VVMEISVSSIHLAVGEFGTTRFFGCVSSRIYI
jgi:hypothetical protein